MPAPKYGPIVMAYIEHKESVEETAKALELSESHVRKGIATYTAHKRDAIRIEATNAVIKGELTYKAAAKKYKVGESTITNWMRMAREGLGADGAKLAISVSAEVELINRTLKTLEATLMTQTSLIETLQARLESAETLLESVRNRQAQEDAAQDAAINGEFMFLGNDIRTLSPEARVALRESVKTKTPDDLDRFRVAMQKCR